MHAERSPVVVGVGQVLANRDRTVAGAREPLRLIADAVHAAAADACGSGTRLLREVDAITVPHVASWAYADLPALLAERLAASPARTFAAPVGGQWPAALVDAAAARIAAGESRIELVAGGEASASLGVLQRAGVDPGPDLGWTTEPGGVAPIGPDDLGSPAMQAAGLVLPTRVYPMVDTAFGHAVGETPAETMASGAAVFAALSEVAAKNPIAWNPAAKEPADILRVGPENRMICEPYPLAVNAFPLVDQAAALLLTSQAVALEHGVPEERLVHVWGGAGAADAADVLARPVLTGSPALCSALDRALASAGLAADAVDLVDVYSCFPVVPRLASRYLGLPTSALAGATGGHSSFGGPLSTYTLHSLAACAERIRDGAGTALVHANGGYLTRQHAVVLGRERHVDGYIGDPEPHDTAVPGPAPCPVAEVADAPVRIEAATVEYDRDGHPAQGFLVARTADGRRLAGCTAEGDAASAQALTVFPAGPSEPAGEAVVGREVRVRPVGDRIQVDPV
ncbi:acetyl-CoA acetyltransferase [Pseudonocardia kujensis]|uniref:acetyl-CoA acetyltransferase n=1 Tax=Pseudonocardia kujensis TaxID=1128675 RepID=UPI001E45CDB7|nr:acetyl-CoA acetyltransferase [Pseudonocardia kujensis]MCE0763396.1 acetyl-CoA acetyltransferase [Pseudonocardia kujensis]